MKSFVITVVFALILAVLFVGGVLTNSTLPAISGFCLWTPAIFMLGWTARGIGKRLVLVDVEQDVERQPAPLQTAATTVNGSYSRLKRLSKESDKPL